MTTPAHDKQLAKDVARQLDRRQLRRKLLLLALLVAAVVVAVLYLTCGRGFGIGGAGKGEGKGPGSSIPADAGPHRCAVRVTQTGVIVDGKAATREQAIAACKATDGADVVVTGDARQGDWDALRAAFEAAGIPVFTKQR
jgi:hypothetical protein